MIEISVFYNKKLFLYYHQAKICYKAIKYDFMYRNYLEIMKNGPALSQEQYLPDENFN